jgi:hypothetical protein
MIENLGIKVDSEEIPRGDIAVSLHGNTYLLDEMETEYDDRWEVSEEGLVTVRKAGGLPPGKHKIEVAPYLRISYLPFILTGQDIKVLTLA